MEHVKTAVETGRMQQYAAVRIARVELAWPATNEAKGTCAAPLPVSAVPAGLYETKKI